MRSKSSSVRPWPMESPIGGEIKVMDAFLRSPSFRSVEPSPAAKRIDEWKVSRRGDARQPTGMKELSEAYYVTIRGAGDGQFRS